MKNYSKKKYALIPANEKFFDFSFRFTSSKLMLFLIDWFNLKL